MYYKAFLKKISLALIGCTLVGLPGYCQIQDSLNLPEVYYPSNYYSQLSVGFSNPVYRDFATSPLFYNGLGVNLTSSWLKQSFIKEQKFQVGFGFSAVAASVPKSNFIEADGSASFFNLDLYYHHLWRLESFSDTKNNLKIGGAVIISQNLRINNYLQNNAVGLENISNLMASAQLTRDISRREPKQLNLLIFKPTLKPAERDLRFQLNMGVLNFNYRPGYAYSYDSEIVGTETNILEWALSNYKWSMNGWRLNTQIEFIKYLPNGNARSWSYIWEAAHAPGKFEAFQMASHRIQYTIFFHTNKR